MSALKNCFLIREPERVVASYAAVRNGATLDDIGFVQQAELFDFVANTTGETPIVIDSRDFLLQPESMLRALCARLGTDFDENMLSWPKGPRESDGIWAKYWYDSVWNSQGFARHLEKPLLLNATEQAIAEQATPYYEALYQHRLQV